MQFCTDFFIREFQIGKKFRQQIDEFAVIRMSDPGDPSLIFDHPDQGTTIQGSICEAEYKVAEGHTIELSLRVVGNCLHTLDIINYHPSPITEPIQPDKIDVFWSAEPGKKGWWEK